jgi:integrase
VSNNNLPLRDIAGSMYIPGSAHIERRRQLGKATQIETLLDARKYINRIISDFGDRPITGITADEIVNHLFSVDRSGSWKNHYIAFFKEIFLEASRYGCKITPPVFPAFALNSKKADKFTGAELAAFFKPENFPDNQLFTLFLLILSAGLRLGEARAVRQKQIFFNEKLLIVDGFLKRNGFRTDYNKKGSPDNPKFRAVLLPDLTLDYLYNHIKNTPLEPDDLIFTVEGRPVRQEYAENVFSKALIKAGIAHPAEKLKGDGVLKKGHITKKADLVPNGRKLVPHSLRYTYVSRMRLFFSAKELQPMTGHTTESMVDYYNRKNLEDVIKALPPANTALEALLDFRAE